MELEAQASAIAAYTVATVPGLLQTEAYAREVLRHGLTSSEEQRENFLATRLDRQSMLSSVNPPLYWVILDEAALHRACGGPPVMREQLSHLLAMAARPTITIQMLSFASGAHPSMGGSLFVLELPTGKRAAYTEDAFSGRLTEERPEAAAYALAYDRLRAMALSPDDSMALISRVLEESYRDPHTPTRPQRRRLAQVQLQQSGRGRVRRSR
ncbi:DUF5753 domain-containing protein [Streptomyces sp. NPDC052396]|uniref:DUF5753 domain-containing protein n=1 Tax=Streptomyces sp. NPDC052396 TaxID=3365689 RepID=UPI0037D17666